MDFHSYITMRDWTRRAMPGDRLGNDIDFFYKQAMADAVRRRPGQFLGQMLNERDWEKARRPYYNVFPSIIPMLTRLNLNLDSSLIRLPAAGPVRPSAEGQAKNPLTFDWKDEKIAVRSMLLGEINDGTGISVLIHIGELMPDIGFPIYSYRNFRRRNGLTVETPPGTEAGLVCRNGGSNPGLHR